MAPGMPTKVTCPRCGETEGVELLWGFPSPEAFAASDRGELAIGGCDLPCAPNEGLPDRQCLTCDYQWREMASLIDGPMGYDPAAEKEDDGK